MNTIHLTLLRTISMCLAAISLASCSLSSAPSVPVAPNGAATATGVLEVLPTPTTAAAAIPSAVSADTPATPVPPDETWTQESFGEAWAIGFPADWTVNDAGAHEGALQVEGSYEGHTYSVTYSYPIGILAETLEAWVDEVLLPLNLSQREEIVVSDVMVANTPAKKVLNMPLADGAPLAHHVYIWRSENKNPRLITIIQTDGQAVNAVAMDQLLDRLLVTVQ